LDLSPFVSVALARTPGTDHAAFTRVVALRCAGMPWAGSADQAPERGPQTADLSPQPLLDLSGGARGTWTRLASALNGAEYVVGFDLARVRGELARTGVSAAVLDLGDLASVLVPSLASYVLPAVCRVLDVEAPDERDPVAVARASASVFARLSARIAACDLDTLMHVNRLAAPLDWPAKRLFAQAERWKMRSLLSGQTGAAGPSLFGPSLGIGTVARQREPLTPNARLQKVDVAEVAAMLTGEGQVGRSLFGFEERPEQIAMARRLARAFNGESPLLVEAGTGTGKSLAYLLPAVLFALANNRRVVVSTNTINLQDQLFRKDLPEVLRSTGLSAKAVVLKGRTNYLCLRRWYAMLRSEDLADHERSMLIKTLLWVPRTETGDRAELTLNGREEEAWGRVCALAETCTPLNCQFHRAGVCFLARARRAAEEAHLVIVNHALLLADCVSRSRVLPEFEHLIIDEAHHLEREATGQMGWRASQRELSARLGVLLDPAAPHAAGITAEVIRLLRSERGRAGREAENGLDALERSVQTSVQRAKEQLDVLFSGLTAVAKAHGQAADGQVVARLSGAVRTQPAWSEVELAWDELSSRLQGLCTLLGELERLIDQSVGDAEAWEDVAPELVGQHSYWEELRARLGEVLADSSPQLIAWLTAARNEDLWLSCAPLHVGPLLREALFDEKETLVLTSATLSTDGHFRYVKERLGLEDADELQLGSPFLYERAALVLLPSDVPEPNQPGYQEAVAEAILRVATATQGRCLVLFTSYAQLRSSYQSLRGPLTERGITLLAQGAEGTSRAVLLEAFKRGERSVLFGTSSFWEGVDVVGDALSCVIMPRLPFSVPSDPVFEARSELFEDPFRQYAVPQAILRFKQGFGRLIRSRTDRGAVVMLDRRLVSKFYGRAFLRSLPGCTFSRVPVVQTGQAVASWLAQSDGTDGGRDGSLAWLGVTGERRVAPRR
jgi:DNA polymerase-3 subunit epsilon/ATP-dependent DNA helicase DinG